MHTAPRSSTPGRYKTILPFLSLTLTSGLILAGCSHTAEKLKGEGANLLAASKDAGGLNLVKLTPETESALNLGCEKVAMRSVESDNQSKYTSIGPNY